MCYRKVCELTLKNHNHKKKHIARERNLGQIKIHKQSKKLEFSKKIFWFYCPWETLFDLHSVPAHCESELTKPTNIIIRTAHHHYRAFSLQSIYCTIDHHRSAFSLQCIIISISASSSAHHHQGIRICGSIYIIASALVSAYHHQCIFISASSSAQQHQQHPCISIVGIIFQISLVQWCFNDL